MGLFGRKKTGFADTKQVPHANHPAHYRKTGNDDIEYITTTHHNPAKIKGKTINTVPLNDNFNPKDKKQAYVVPIVYEGKRSALGRERPDYNLTKNDKKIVDKIFENSPREKVTKTSNSKNKTKKKKR